MSSPFRFLPSRTAACFVGVALLLILTGGCGSAYNAQATTDGASDRAATGAAPPAEAPAAAHSDPSSPEAIIARYIEAVGGEAALRAHTSMTTKGAFEMPAMGASGEAILYQMAPDKLVAIITIPGMGESVQGYNGEIGWAEDMMQGPRLLDGDMLEQERRGARFHAELEYPDLFPERTTAGEVEWDGQAAWQLDLVDAKGNEESHFFAQDSNLLIGVESTTSTEMGTMDAATTLSDYQEFGGIQLPTVMNMSLSMGVEFTITTESVTFDDVDPSVFEPSDAIKALLPE